MEALRKLEEEQRMVQLTQLRGFVGTSSSLPNHPDSDRFVAQFVLFLMQPCGELDPVMKCHLISQLMPKMSESFLEEASVWLHEEGFQKCLVGRPSIPSYEENKIDNGPHLLQTHFTGKAMVGLEAMQRANSTLEDFLDSWNEKMLQIPTAGVNNLEAMSQEANRSLICKFAEPFRTDPLRELGLLLEHLGLLTERIGEELAYGKEYWALEQKLCRSLMRNEEISIDDAMRAIHLKSFDYRVLNLLLYQLRGEEVNELHMEFLSISEFLVEISDDLFDYEDDVLENNFNILRMFTRIYGASTATTMLAKCITEAEEKYDGILRSLDSELAFKYQKRCEEATREGGKTSGHALGTWSMPPVIADEDSYRSKLSNSDSSAV